jgi:hypothetical protein
MGGPADDFISMTRRWVQALRERCKEDEAYELVCATPRGWMQVGFITVQNDSVAIITGADADGNFIERLGSTSAAAP